MRADEFNEQRLPEIIHGCYQAVLIAADIENHPAVGNETGTSIHGFDIVWLQPLCLLCFVVPGFQGLFRIWMLLPKFPQGPFRDHSHGYSLACSHIGNNRPPIQ